MPGFVVRPAVQAVDHVPEVRGRGGMAEDVHFRLRKAAMANLSLLNKVLIGLDAGSLAAAQVFEFRVFDDEIIGKAFVENGRDFLGRLFPCWRFNARGRRAPAVRRVATALSAVPTPCSAAISPAARRAAQDTSRRGNRRR